MKKYIVVGLDETGVFLCGFGESTLDEFNVTKPKTLEEAKLTKEVLSREYPNIQYFVMELKDYEE